MGPLRTSTTWGWPQCSSSKPDDLPYLDVVGHQVLGQAGSIGVSSLNADQPDLAERSCEREE